MGFASVRMIKRSSRRGVVAIQTQKTSKALLSEPGGRRGERTNERDSGGKINTKAYEDTEGWRERERESAASRLTAA